MDIIEQDIMDTIYGVYVIYRQDREGFKRAILAHRKVVPMPDNLKETFVNMALQVYDEMDEMEKRR